VIIKKGFSATEALFYILEFNVDFYANSHRDVHISVYVSASMLNLPNNEKIAAVHYCGKIA
jgi:hypothetical protein